jgi:tape measure domain-containing protein
MSGLVVQVGANFQGVVDNAKKAAAEVQKTFKEATNETGGGGKTGKGASDAFEKMARQITVINKRKKDGSIIDRNANTHLSKMQNNLKRNERLLRKGLRVRERILKTQKRGTRAHRRTQRNIILMNKKLKKTLALEQAIARVRGGGDAGNIFGGMKPGGGGGMPGIGLPKGMMGMIKGFAPQFAAAAIAVDALRGAMNGLAQGIMSLPERAKEVAALRTALGAYLDTENEISYVVERAKATAMEYGASVTAVSAAYKRLGPAAAASGMSLADTDLLITSLTARTAQLGLNSEQTGRYMEAMAQVMGKGTLQGEELTQQFSELDGALRTQVEEYLQATYGIENLADAMSKGEVSASMFAEAVIGISGDAVKKLKIDFDNLISSIDKLNPNQIENLFGNLTKAIQDDALKVFKPWIDGFNEVKMLILGGIASFNERFPELTRFLTQIFTELQKKASIVTKLFLIAIDYVIQGLEWMIKALKKVGNGVQWLANKVSFGLVPAVKEGEDSYDAWGSALEWVDNALNNHMDNLGIVTAGVEAQQEEMRRLRAELDEKARSDEAVAKALAKQQTKLNSVKKAMEDYRLEATNAAGSTFDFDKQLKQLQTDLTNTAISAEDTAKSIFDVAKAMMDSRKAAIDATYKKSVKGIKEEYEQWKQLHDDKMRGYNEEIDKLKQRKANSDAYYTGVKANITRMAELQKRAHEDEMKEIDAKIAKEKERHKSRMAGLNAEIDRINAKYDLEEGRINETGPAQRALRQYEEKQLRARAQNTALSQKERLEAAAKLEQMQKEDKVLENNKKRNEEIAAIKTRIANEEKTHANNMKELNEEKAKQEEKNLKQQREIKDLKFNTAEAQRKENEYIRQAVAKINEKKKAEEKIKVTKEKTRDAALKVAENVKTSAEAANTLASNIDNVNSRLDYTVSRSAAIRTNFVEALKAWQQTQGQQSGGPPAPPAFAGGPVSGGALRTVNELGQEGFLSSSGKLSAINAPAWGTWRAPSSGEIIPAHIFSKMANASYSGNVAGVSGRRQVHQVRSGDNISNNVTIQTTNPRAVAGDVLVQLARLKRLRYGR